ncbi:MAG: MlaD family protein [Calditrichaceae bacterium]|jgi:phospholipid/cholesterol/gamma-HCH transport system substrate-binding protein
MISKSQKIRLGIFVFIAAIILITTIAVLSMNQYLKKQDIYYIAYENVSVLGLNVGSTVKYLGISVGTVRDIKIDPDNVNRVIVTVSLKEGTPVKEDVRADITTLGITGLKAIELRGGTNESALLEPEGYIKAGTSMMEEITGKTEVIAEKIELALNNIIRLTSDTNQDEFITLLKEATIAISQFNDLLEDSSPKIGRSITNLDLSMAELSGASKSANNAVNKIEEFVYSDSVRIALKNISEVMEKLNKANIYTIDQNINLAVSQMNDVLNKMDHILKYNLTVFNATMEDLNETSRHLNNAARKIDENPSILLFGGSEPKNPPDEKLEH